MKCVRANQQNRECTIMPGRTHCHKTRQWSGSWLALKGLQLTKERKLRGQRPCSALPCGGSLDPYPG